MIQKLLCSCQHNQVKYNVTERERDFVLVKIQGNSTLIFRQMLIDGEHRYLKPMNPDFAAFPMRLLREEDRILGVLVELRHRYHQ